MTTRAGRLSTKKQKSNKKGDGYGVQNSAPLDSDDNALGDPSIQDGGSDIGLDTVTEAVREVLTGDAELVQPLIASVVAGILNCPEVFDSLVTAVAKAVAETIANKIKPDVTQSIYESVSTDISSINDEIKALRTELGHVKSEKNQLETRVEDAEQYSRRNCLLLHGVPENTGENTTSVVIGTINDRLGLDLERNHLDRTHRLGRPKRPDDTKPRPIIIKFVSYTERSQVYATKRKLKGTSMLISENLTVKRMEIFRAARLMAKEGKISSTWTQDGRITVLTNQDRKVIIKSLPDLDKL